MLTTAVKDYTIIEHFERTRRSRLAWSRAHDWKSCKPQKGFEGSNPSFSAKRNEVTPIFVQRCTMIGGTFMLATKETKIK